MSQADQETLLEEANEAAIHRALAFRASRYLLAGTVCGMIGGVYSTYICYAFSSDYRRHLNMEGEQFPSGKAYWPPSVSNWVDNIDSPRKSLACIHDDLRNLDHGLMVPVPVPECVHW
mmetsp:Transcript_67175/g.196418  ORF Transcript_67175/g.196418 Transcript_67175/m.196418 type:complete len:118 (+) Transcript_67175:159-512(+)